MPNLTMFEFVEIYVEVDKNNPKWITEAMYHSRRARDEELHTFKVEASNSATALAALYEEVKDRKSKKKSLRHYIRRAALRISQSRTFPKEYCEKVKAEMEEMGDGK